MSVNSADLGLSLDIWSADLQGKSDVEVISCLLRPSGSGALPREETVKADA